jgi:hypothetical protein
MAGEYQRVHVGRIHQRIETSDHDAVKLRAGNVQRLSLFAGQDNHLQFGRMFVTCHTLGKVSQCRNGTKTSHLGVQALPVNPSMTDHCMFATSHPRVHARIASR